MKYLFVLISLLLAGQQALAQRDMDIHVARHLLAGKNIICIKQDRNDAYLWALAANNEVYLIDANSGEVTDRSAVFSHFQGLLFVDIAGVSKDEVFIASRGSTLIYDKNGMVTSSTDFPAMINSIGFKVKADENNGSLVLMIATDAGYCTYNLTSGQLKTENTGPSQVYESTWRKEMYKDSTAAYENRLTSDTVRFMPVAYRDPFSGYVEFFRVANPTFGYPVRTGAFTTPALTEEAYTEDNYIYWATNKGLFRMIGVQSGQEVFKADVCWNRPDINKITDIFGLTVFANNALNPSVSVHQNLLLGTDHGLYFTGSIFHHYTTLRDFFYASEVGDVKVNDICVNLASVKPICEDGAWIATTTGLYQVKTDYGAYFDTQAVIPQSIAFDGYPPGKLQYDLCAGSAIIAQTTGPNFDQGNLQWYKDGAAIPGQTQQKLTITASGVYHAVLYDPCSGLHAESNRLTVNVIESPVFTFDYPATIMVCAGEMVPLTIQANSAYQYRWFKDEVQTTETNNTFNVTGSGIYRAEVSSCGGSWIKMASVNVQVTSFPEVNITANKPSYCVGEYAQIDSHLTVVPGFQINWRCNGQQLPAFTGLSSISTNIAGDYQIVLTNELPGCEKRSVIKTITFDPPPSFTIQKIVKTTLCDGQDIDLQITGSNGTVKWSTGAQGNVLTISHSGSYTATLTTPGGCSTGQNIVVDLLPNPTLHLKDTTLCTYTTQTLTLTAPPGLVKYDWNHGQSQLQTFTVSTPQNITLTVTDANGCTATQEIKILSSCPDIHLANTFTPNGDGINDTWNISGIENDESVSIAVFNRYGGQVYFSKGNYSPWNGQYKGKLLPAGVYYYILKAKNGKLTLSGTLTIIY